MNIKAKLSIAGEPLRIGEASTWDEITDKPFSEVDTENGLAIYDDTLMLDTLDTIATIDYVNGKIDEVEADIPSLDGYATEQYVDNAVADIDIPTADGTTIIDNNGVWSAVGGGTTTVDWDDVQNKPTFATVATSGDYDDLSNKPTIPSIDGLATEQYVDDAIADIDIPEDVSELNNDAGYITNSALSGYATETYVDSAVDGITTTLETDYATKAELPVATSDLTNDSGFITASALTPYAESADLAAVATSGSYNDLSNKPTIPQPTSVTVTQGLTTGVTVGSIDVDGVTTTLYAPAGGSVDIDNKSIIENGDGELQEAVPLYTEVISHQVGGVGLNVHNYKGNGTTDGDFYLDTNETQLTFVSGATSANNFYNVVIFGVDGWISAKWRNYTGITNNCVIDDASSNFSAKIGQQIQCYYRYQQNSTYFPNGNHYGVIFHIYSTPLSPFTQWTDFLIYPTADGIAAGDTLETQCETLGLDWAQGVWNEQYISKLPNQYLSIKTDEIITSNYYPMLYNDDAGNIRAKKLGAGSNMSLATINLGDGTQGYQFSCTLKESPVGGYTNGDRGSTSLYMSNFEDISGGNPFKRRYYTTQTNWNSFFNNAGSDKDLVFSLNYCISSTYYNMGPKITGIIHLGATNTDQPVIEGFEEIIDSYYIDTTNTNKYFCIELKDGYNIGFSQNITMLRPATYYPTKANINSLFLPLDNSTIVRDSDGNIKTAIPAAPTTAGTYTLQVVVDSDGNPTYSWI